MRTQVRDVISKIGGFSEVLVKGPAPASKPLEYRNNMQYAFAISQPAPESKESKSQAKKPSSGSSGSKKQTGQIVVGFHSKGTQDRLVAVDSCLLPSQEALTVYDSAKRLLLETGLTPEKGKVGVRCVNVCVCMCVVEFCSCMRFAIAITF
jgi:hypothetical protein